VYAQLKRLGRRTSHIKTPTTFKKLFDKIVDHIGEYNNPNRDSEANSLIHYLRTQIRPDKALRDKYYLAYSDCVCCGASSMGYELPLRNINRMLMPICDDCFNTNFVNNIQWDKVAEIYYGYSQVIEQAADYYTERL
jgi:hypothetical protein